MIFWPRIEFELDKLNIFLFSKSKILIHESTYSTMKIGFHGSQTKKKSCSLNFCSILGCCRLRSQPTNLQVQPQDDLGAFNFNHTYLRDWVLKPNHLHFIHCTNINSTTKNYLLNPLKFVDIVFAGKCS